MRTRGGFVQTIIETYYYMFSTWNVQSNVLQYYDVCPCMCVCVCACALMHMQTPVYLYFTLTEC